MKFLSIFLHILIGLLFIFSGYSKIILIEPFEYKLVEAGISWEFSLLLARLLIGLEWALGILLLFYWNFNKKVWMATLAILLIFSLQLLVQIAAGDTSNCGCFGELIPFTPAQALLKNLGLFILLGLAWYSFRPMQFKKQRLAKILSLIVAVVVLLLPFILNPMNYATSSRMYERNDRFKLGLDTLYNQTELPIPPIELRKGKHFVGFLSLGCSHCKVAATKIGIIQKQNPNLPIFIVYNGDPTHLDDFLTETKSESVPHYLLPNRKIFFSMAGGSVPTIYWVKNDSVYTQSTHLDLKKEQMEDWMEED